MKLILGVFAIGILIIYALIELSPDPIGSLSSQSHTGATHIAGDFPTNNELKSIQRIGIGQEAVHTGPMFVNTDFSGDLYTGYANGDVVKMNLDGGNPKLLAKTDGRPLAVRLLRDGSLIIADAVAGLIRVGTNGVTESVFKTPPPKPFKLITDVLVSSDESFIYFTEASSKFDLNESMIAILEHGENGTVYAYDTRRDEIQVLANGFVYSNGLAFGPNQDFLLVTESGNGRIWKVLLRGDKRGQKEIFIDGLPGIPYYISFNGRDCFWVPIAYTRNTWFDSLAKKKIFRRLIAYMPVNLLPNFKTQSWVLGFDISGNTLYNLQYTGDNEFSPITSVTEHQKHLYFGSNERQAIGRFDLISK